MANFAFVGLIIWMFWLRFVILTISQTVFTSVTWYASFWCVSKLPLQQRRQAQKEINALLWIARWAVIACYTIWTIKDMAEFLVL